MDRHFRLPLQERLPAIAIPLRQMDRYVALDLQAFLDRCCEEALFDDDIDYREEAEPRLDADDALWADALIREHGRR
jgi:hypothetical protein